MQVKKQQLEPDMEKLTGSKLEKEYCHSAYLTYTPSTSYKWQAGWITSWNQDCLEKYQQPQMCKWYHSKGRKWRETKEPLDGVKEENEKAGLKVNIKKKKNN